MNFRISTAFYKYLHLAGCLRTHVVKSKRFEILIVEDNPGDAFLVRQCLKILKTPTQSHWVQNGQEAMMFLRKEGEFSGMPRPDIILLDLNLPLKDGRKVLAEIKGDDKLGAIPVIILTSSESQDDVTTAYRLHASSYLCKPAVYEGLLQLFRV